MDRKSQIQGVLYAILSYTCWGLFPLYWKMLANVSPLEVLMHRILWSAVFMYCFCVFLKRNRVLPVFKDRKTIWKLLCCGCLIMVNWGLYIWAVVNNHIVEASLGYYINPLIVIFLGVVFLRERLSKLQIAAVLIALSGVVYFTIDYGRLPWISLVLATSFAIYGLIKKNLKVSSLQGLTVETMLMAPVALFYLMAAFYKHENVIFTGFPFTNFLLMMGGVVTALPLYWFGIAAGKISFTSIGFTQYISPTLQLLIGVFVYHENFTHAHLICFIFIWTALLLYAGSIVYALRKKKENAIALEIS